MSAAFIPDITLGVRHRKDLGDINGLAKSIDEVGLLHPIVVRADDGVLIAGERRLAACKQLGWDHIPVTFIDLAEIAHGEFAENAQRKDFLPSEIDAIRRAIEPLEKAAATSRKISGRSASDKGETRDKIGAFAGVSGRTVEKIRHIVEAAERDPERFGKLKEDMDRTGHVNGPHKRLQVALKADAIKQEPPPLPSKGPYCVIVADPPWPYEKRQSDPSHRGTYPYPSMSLKDICALDVHSLAHADSILWLWTTNHHMRDAFDVLDAWGFKQKTILTWVKDKMGLGDWLRGQSEHCLMAVRGNPVVHLTNQTTILQAPVRAHSQKPEEFYALVDQPRDIASCFHDSSASDGMGTAMKHKEPQHDWRECGGYCSRARRQRRRTQYRTLSWSRTFAS